VRTESVDRNRWRIVLIAAFTTIVLPVIASASDESACKARNGASAIAACTNLIDLGKARGTALYLHYNDRGGAHQSIGGTSDHRHAIDDFSKAIGIEPKLPYAFINRGVSWAALGAYDRAIGDFAQALRVDPKSALAYNNRGGAHRDRGEFDRAMADFNKAIDIDPKLADARFNRGTVYMQKEVYSRAITDYSAVIKQYPNDILALAARGRAWSSTGDLGRAKSDFEAVIAAPAADPQSRAVKDAVRELLRALIEKRAAIEQEATPAKKEAAEKAVRDKQAAAEKKAAEKQAAAPPPPPAVSPPLPEPPRKIERLALVIGNAAYLPALGALENPGHDADDIAQMLTALGFTVWLRHDLGHAAMKEVLASFARAARDVETVVVYFAGHGFQHGGANYLAAIDSPIVDDEGVDRHVSLNSVMAAMKAERGVRILIIDACRNNLAIQRAAETSAAGAQPTQIKRGLAPVDRLLGGGMLIAFATLPGDIASEGAGRNSPFTHSLVRHLPTPNLELRHLFVRVRADVVTATLGRQNPEVSDSLVGEYVFTPVAQSSTGKRR